MRCTGSQAKESSYRPDQYVRSTATCSNGGVRGRTAVETTSLPVLFHSVWDADQGGALAAFLSRLQLPTWPVTGNPRVLAESRDELIEHYFRVGP